VGKKRIRENMGNFNGKLNNFYIFFNFIYIGIY
jgi:hypothetical protein